MSKTSSKHQPTRNEVVGRGEYLGFKEFANGVTEQRWNLGGIVFSEICDAKGRRASWRCLGKASRALA